MSSTTKHKDRSRLLFDEIRKFVSIPQLLSPLPADPSIDDQSSESNDGNQFKPSHLDVICAGSVVEDNTIRIKKRIKQLKELRRFYRLPKLLTPLKADSTKNRQSQKRRTKNGEKTGRENECKSVNRVLRTLSIDDIRPFYGLPRLLSPLSSDNETDEDDHSVKSSTYGKLTTTTIEVVVNDDIDTYYEDLRKKKEWALRKRKEEEFKKESESITESVVPQRNYEDLKEEVFGFVLPSKPLIAPETEVDCANEHKPNVTVEKKHYRTQREVDKIYSNGLLFNSAHSLLKIVTKNKPVVESNSSVKSFSLSKPANNFKSTTKALSSTSSRSSLLSWPTSTTSVGHPFMNNLSNILKCIKSCNSSETYSQPSSPFPLSPATTSSLCTSGSLISTSESTSVSTRTNSSVQRQRVITVEKISRRLLRKQKAPNSITYKEESNFSDYISDYRNREVSSAKVIPNGQQFVKEKVLNWNIIYENVLTPPTPLNIPDDFETPPSSPKTVAEDFTLVPCISESSINAPLHPIQVNSVNNLEFSGNCFPTPDGSEVSLCLNPVMSDIELNKYLDSIAAEDVDFGTEMDTDEFFNKLSFKSNF